MFRFATPLLGAALSLAGLAALPAAAQTVCNNETMAGVWIAGPDFGGASGFCRIILRENGRFRGFCNAVNGTFPWHAPAPRDESNVSTRGRLTVQQNCQIFGVFRFGEPPEEQRRFVRGYAWGGDVPMAIHLVSTTRELPGGWTFIRQIEFEED